MLKVLQNKHLKALYSLCLGPAICNKRVKDDSMTPYLLAVKSRSRLTVYCKYLKVLQHCKQQELHSVILRQSPPFV